MGFWSTLKGLLFKITEKPKVSVSFKFKETGFKAYELKKDGFKPRWIVIHHSLSKDDSQTRNWDAIRKYHLSKGWRDVGYHFGIEYVEGKLKVLEGRAVGDRGAHAIGFNRSSIGICLVGNFDNVSPSQDQFSALASLCRGLQRDFDIDRDQVIGHRETYDKRNVAREKSCPGELFDMDKFRLMCTDPGRKLPKGERYRFASVIGKEV